MILLSIICLIVGAFPLMDAKACWHLLNWWKYRGKAHPNENTLLLYRFIGICLILLAVYIYIQPTIL